jgi:hypothetical protein
MEPGKQLTYSVRTRRMDALGSESVCKDARITRDTGLRAATTPSIRRNSCTRELGLSEDVVNVEGGAIAHGHPIGASGAVLATRLMHSMRRDGLKRGVATLCIGGGQGIALALETV